MSDSLKKNPKIFYWIYRRALFRCQWRNGFSYWSLLTSLGLIALKLSNNDIVAPNFWLKSSQQLIFSSQEIQKKWLYQLYGSEAYRNSFFFTANWGSLINFAIVSLSFYKYNMNLKNFRIGGNTLKTVLFVEKMTRKWASNKLIYAIIFSVINDFHIHNYQRR